ncbi:MAG: DUF104 domain-containing protein [Chloroflexales bacterium]|nr:DUF104 domain-containing protein [Chloroflexales bacterium]
MVRAVYDGEVLRPAEPLGLPPGTPVRIVVSPAIPEDAAAERPPPARGWASRPLAWLAPSRAEGAARLTRAELALLAAGLAFYALTRLVGLAAFPIYFFCDEAIQTTLARELLDSGLRDVNGVLLPPYFRNAEKWNLSLSVYIHALSVALFGQSVALTRGTSVAVSILGVAAVALTLRLVFRSGSWWVAPFALAAMPAWFLHSRTAFETTMMVSFYACFLCCYLLYRTRGPRWLLPALVFGAMTFYSYANGQGVMLVSGVLLLLCDLPYHLRQGWRVWALGAGALALLAVPLLRFRLLQPDAYAEQLRLLGSSWVSPLPLAAKLGTFGANYLQGLSPTYWFLYNTVDLERHRMRGMGHLGLWLAPFVLLGLVVCLRRLASPAHRAVLVAVLAAPFSAALVAIAITRTLAMVVPAAILAVLGLDQVAAWAGPRLRQRWVAAAAAAALAVICLTVTRAALVEGPTWFSDYGMGGMQYGARQLFAESIPEELARSPGTTLLVSPTWANNPNVFLPFFLTPAQSERVQLINIDAFTTSKLELDPARQLFVMPQDEYARANESGKFVLQPPERIISYPDGRPGFYFVRMAYVPNIDELFAADRAARARLVEDEATIGGQAARVAHSLLDMGQVANLFDGDPKTLARGAEANPFVLQLSFAEPRALSGVTLTTASMNFELTMRATPVDGEDAVAGATFVDLPPDPTVRLDLPGGPRQVRELRLEIHQLNVPEVAHVHVRELELR